MPVIAHWGTRYVVDLKLLSNPFEVIEFELERGMGMWATNSTSGSRCEIFRPVRWKRGAAAASLSRFSAFLPALSSVPDAHLPVSWIVNHLYDRRMPGHVVFDSYPPPEAVLNPDGEMLRD